MTTAWALMVVTSCHELPEVTVTGERVRIAPYHDAPICAGTVAQLEHLVEDLEDDIGLSSSKPLTFYWGYQAVEDNCDAGLACSRPEHRQVFGRMSFTRHEFAHVVGGEVGVGETFVEEAFATLHSDECAFVDFSTVPLEVIGVSASIFDERAGEGIAAHFAKYLSERHGERTILDWKAESPRYSSRDEVSDAFESVFGRTLAEATDDWRLSAPFRLCSLEVPPVDAIWNGTAIEFAMTLDCDAEDTRGPYDEVLPVPPDQDPSSIDVIPIAFRQWLFEVPFQAEVELGFDGGPDARVWLTDLDCVGASTTGDHDYLLHPGERLMTSLSACTWQITAMGDPQRLTTARLLVSPSEPEDG